MGWRRALRRKAELSMAEYMQQSRRTHLCWGDPCFAGDCCPRRHERQRELLDEEYRRVLSMSFKTMNERRQQQQLSGE